MFAQFLSIFINVVTPVFALVVIGYVAGPRLGLQVRTLSRLSYFILVPAFIFDIISQANVEVGLAARMILFIITVHVGCGVVGFTVARLLGRPAETIAAYVLVAVFGNVANFGLSMVKFRLGEAALAPASIYFLIINITAFVIGVSAAHWARGGKLGGVAAVFKTPAILAFIPAAFFWTTQLEVPLFAARIAGLLGSAMIPVMLVAMGVQLAQMGLPRLTGDVVFASAVRLVAGPALAALLVVPFGLAGPAGQAGILQAAMPPAVLTTIIAMEHNLAPDFVTTTLLFATVASLLTLTVVMALV